MSTKSSFIRLLRYQAWVSPAIWIFPLVILFQVGFFQNEFIGSLKNFAVMQGVYLWMPLITAWMIFASETLIHNRTLTHQTHVMANSLNAEFLITRAINRSSIFWSRCVLYWIMLLIPCLMWITVTLFHPKLTIVFPYESETMKSSVEYYLSQIPGSLVEQVPYKDHTRTAVQSGHGNLIIKSASVMLFLTIGLFCQWLVLCLRKFRYAKYILWTLFITLVSSPVAMAITSIHPMEDLLFQVIHHQWIALGFIVTFLLLICHHGKKMYLSQEYA